MAAGLFVAILVAAAIGVTSVADRAAETAAVPAAPATPSPYPSVLITEVPHIAQRPDFCGEACAAMYLAKLGHAMDQDDVFDQAGLNPELGRGCYTRELVTALTRIGFRVGPTWYTASAARAESDIDERFQELHADLKSGIPSIVCMRYDDRPETTEHFRLVLGYDAETDSVVYHEPAESRGAYRRMARLQFQQLWPLKYDEQRWTLIRLRLVPGRIRAVHNTARRTAADYAQRVMQVKSKAPTGFTFVVQEPFVVAGDGPAAEVRRIATGTIGWAVTRLKQEYFAAEPAEILDVWLFKDDASYRQHTEKIFGDTPHTPFGYYSHQHQALIMNIDTGTGTLVHELVHPFIAADFPQCPSWFNEGLASLYEQCGDHRGRIWGRTNWRLKGLQEAIQPPPEPEATAKDAKKEDSGEPQTPAEKSAAVGALPAKEVEKQETPRPELPPFKSLCSTSNFGFYYADRGTNYAQARYLCYYLQQRGLLRTYYHRFRRDVQSDPTGYETLKSVLAISDEAEMDTFFQTWKDWVMQLQYP
jgi:hypothetical protein